MLCKNCGKFNPDNTAFCSGCGEPLNGDSLNVPAPAYPVQPAQQPYDSHSPRSATFAIPPEYKPLSPWAYFGYQLLFAIPVVGFILLIIFSCGGTSNINLKNFARSYWCGLLLGLILAVILIILIIAMGGLNHPVQNFR